MSEWAERLNAWKDQGQGLAMVVSLLSHGNDLDDLGYPLVI